MAPAVYDATSADIEAGRAVYRASGSTLKSAGYLAAYGIAAEEEEEPDKEEGASTRLPPLTEGETLTLLSVTPEKKETQPPPRFNEASLVKFLEENGIGRPSTYAEILRKIEDREYVRKKDRRFVPTALGRTVIDMLIPYFDDFFETSYTARMEERLDEVEEGKISWKKALSEFDKTFTRDRDRALADMVSGKAGIPLAEARELLKFPIAPELSEKCPKCGKKLKLRMGKNGLFIACSGYPNCTFTENIPDPDEDVVDATELEKHDVRGMRLADEAADEPGGVGVSGLHGVPEVPQHRQRRDGRRKARGPARRADRGDVSRVGAPAGAPAWPLRRLRRVQRIPRLQVQAPQTRQGHRRALSQGRRDHRRAARPLPSLLRMRQLSGLRFHALGAPDPRGLPQVRQPVLALAREKGRKRPRLRQGRVRLRETGRPASRNEGDLSPLRSRRREEDPSRNPPKGRAPPPRQLSRRSARSAVHWMCLRE